jgi:hypothetical protein
VAGREEVVPFTREHLRSRGATELGSDTIARVEIAERGEESGDIPGVTGGHDVQIEGRDRGAFDHGGDTANQDEANPVASKRREKGREATGRLCHVGVL